MRNWYCSDSRVLLPVLQSVILHCSSLGYRGGTKVALSVKLAFLCLLDALAPDMTPVVGAFLSHLESLSPDVPGPVNDDNKNKWLEMARPRTRVPIWISV